MVTGDFLLLESPQAQCFVFPLEVTIALDAARQLLGTSRIENADSGTADLG